MTATHLKATILAVLDKVAAGEEVEVTKHGRVVARLVPPAGAGSLRGMFAGTVQTAGDDESVFSTGTSWSVETATGSADVGP